MEPNSDGFEERLATDGHNPPTNARDRFMRNPMDLNVLEANNRFPKEG